MVWEIEAELIADWLDLLDDKSFDLVTAAIEMLAAYGPNLGRPLVDSITASRHKNMKELRPGSAGRSEIRILFAFDPERRAIMLVAGDKSRKWQRWYKENIPVADDLYDQHLKHVKDKKHHGYEF